MTAPKFEYRLLERDGYCRLCNCTIHRSSEKVFYKNSYYLKQPVIICVDCVKEMFNEI